MNEELMILLDPRELCWTEVRSPSLVSPNRGIEIYSMDRKWGYGCWNIEIVEINRMLFSSKALTIYIQTHLPNN